MEEAICIENINVQQEAKNWKQAIQVAAKPLLQRGSIEDSYIKEMIHSVDTLGPYIVMMPGFALAHAAPSSAVKHSDLSIATFRENIQFHCENDPVRVVMCLACTDKSSHLKKLQSIAEKMMDENIVEAMCACEDVEALYQLLNE